MKKMMITGVGIVFSIASAAGGDLLCAGDSAVVTLDLTSGSHAAAAMERIRYSSEWVESAPFDALAVVSVEGKILSSELGTGFIEWTPISNGTYMLTHRIMSGKTQYGETLTTTFTVTELENPLTATQTTEVPVPYTWLRQHDFDIADAYEAYEVAAKNVAANGRKVWECYVLGLDPEVATNDFKIVSFPMKADGTPDLANIVFDPPQAQWNVPATWKVKGAATLDGPWGEVPAGGNPAYRFFKVEVVLP